VRQVGFWIIAAQAGVALSLGIPGNAVMGLVGSAFTGGTGALTFLLAAEVIAATAAVSESALVYVARHRNLMISLLMICVQALLTVGLILAVGSLPLEESQKGGFQAAAAAIALMVSLGIASILKARLLSRLLAAPVSGWRWPLVWAAGAAAVAGFLIHLLPKILQLAIGIPAVLVVFGIIIWRRGFTHEDRVLFRMKKGESATLPPPPGALPPDH
jgi:hypothetical protein